MQRHVWGVLLLSFFKNTTKSADEIILKIGQYLTKLKPK